jgi:mannose-6-phosphate isomerase-like protein (cupin superfamily)
MRYDADSHGEPHAPFQRRWPMSDDPMPRYAGPRALAESLSAFARASGPDALWNREGLRDDSEYRDLGLAAATGGRLGVKHIRALKPMTTPTGWHWHDMTAHYVYVLRGSLTFRFAGIEGDVTLRAGDGLSQPAGVPHNVVARSNDLEVIEINEPAEYGTWNLPEPPAPWH